ncbi:MAG: type II secretion system F family protein [Campylobacterales bacterium]
MLFSYQGVDQAGKKVTGQVEAKTIDEAKAKLKAQGIFYQELMEGEQGVRDLLGLFHSKRISALELSRFARDLSIYMKAGVPLVNSVKLARSQYADNPRMSRFIDALSSLLNEGKSFYQALEGQQVFQIPEFFKQSVKISEHGGMIEGVLAQLASFLQDQERLTKQIKGAMTYPIFIIAMSILMISFMLTVVVPKITSVFETMNQELPSITVTIIVLGEFLSTYWLWIFGGIVAVTAGSIYAIRTNPSLRRSYHLLLLRLPFVGRVIELFELARFSYLIAVMMRSGIPFVQTVRLAANTLNNEILKERFIDSADRVVEGERLSVALRKEGYPVEQSFIEAVMLGEETSEVAAIMENLSMLYFEENRDRIGVAVSLIEPVMMLVVGSVIGVIVMAMLLPVFSINIG